MSVKKKLVLISHDALVGEDLAYLQKSEPFRSLLRDGARIRSLRSIYPTVTYPAHASLITGVYPERHGVVGNEVCSIGTLGAPWNWFRPANKSQSLFTAAKEAGMTTAAVFWPVTGNDPDIDYLVDEYWPQSPDETMREALLRAGWCGVRLLATAHAASLQDLYRRAVYRPLVKAQLFSHVLVLHRDKSWREERMEL